jgi:aryl-alcohol dehydrogenase-like predicted oxidoreductase
MMAAATYHLLGRTGLKVSRLCLGAMTFGTDWGWGADEKDCREQLAKFMDRGGNFVDTADVYTGGTSERILGKLIAERQARDQIVLATKFTNNPQPGNPNSGGNGRKNIMRALDASLRRLGTDYIDLYILHAWDRLTHPEEVLRSLEAVVQSGKVRHIGLSDVPAWYAASMQTCAEIRGLEPVSSIQLEYSLIERNIEREFVPLALAKNIGITAWSPLCFGILSGKYKSLADVAKVGGRLAVMQAAPRMPHSEEGDAPAFGVDRLNETSFKIVAELESVSRELGRSMAQVAINWVANRPGVASVILGASKLAQLEDTLQSLEFSIPAELMAKLDKASRPPPLFPYTFFSNAMQAGICGGVTVTDKPPGFWGKR